LETDNEDAKVSRQKRRKKIVDIGDSESEEDVPVQVKKKKLSTIHTTSSTVAIPEPPASLQGILSSHTGIHLRYNLVEIV